MDAYADVWKRLAAFAEGRTGLEAFRDWLVPFSWEIESRGIPRAVAPVRRVELLIAEHCRGHRTLRSVRTEVKAILKNLPALETTDLMVREGDAAVLPKRNSRPTVRGRATRR